MDFFKRLTALQHELKAPKGQFNGFGKYKYRNCEDILEAVKPLLVKHELGLTVSDEIVFIGSRFYVKATAKLCNVDSVGGTEVYGYARECDSKKGMDDAQLTGSCSSYARKYALNGLFLIDDTKDADSMENKPAITAKQDATKPVFSSGMYDSMVEKFTAAIATNERTADQIISKLEEKYHVCNGTKKAIRGIK